MRLARRTYALPQETVQHFEREVDSGDRSARIAELIEKYLENKRREALRRDIAEGCREMWDVYQAEARAWKPTDDAFQHTIGY